MIAALVIRVGFSLLIVPDLMRYENTEKRAFKKPYKELLFLRVSLHSL